MAHPARFRRACGGQFSVLLTRASLTQAEVGTQAEKVSGHPICWGDEAGETVPWIMAVAARDVLYACALV